MSIKRLLLFLCIASFVAATTASATVFVDQIFSDINGYDMAGIKVSVTYGNAAAANITTEATWASGSAATGAWSLTMTDPAEDTVGEDWVLSATSGYLKSFTIDAYSAGILFDIFNAGSAEITPGSEAGTFVYFDGTDYTELVSAITSADPLTGTYANLFNWEFSNIVALAGNAALGDLYGTLKITFLTDDVTSFQFGLDTDAATVVPEPATIALMGVGLLGLAGVGSRMRKSKK